MFNCLNNENGYKIPRSVPDEEENASVTFLDIYNLCRAECTHYKLYINFSLGLLSPD